MTPNFVRLRRWWLPLAAFDFFWAGTSTGWWRLFFGQLSLVCIDGATLAFDAFNRVLGPVDQGRG